MDEVTLARARREFGLEGEPAPLPGGTRQTYRVGDAVLKQIRETSLENNHSPELAAWLAGVFAGVAEAGFRVPRPRATRDGAWITGDGWTAAMFVEGVHATAADIPAAIAAIVAFHRALRGVAKHPLMDDNRTPWGKADRWCWDDRPAWVHPAVAGAVDRLYALRRPVGGLTDQLVHGDLNPENILIAPGRPPAFLDMSPFWRPVEFALAIFANFIGPRQGDRAVLRHFAGVAHFDQLLVRAGIRMLLVMSELGDLDDWANCSERWAAEIIVRHVEGRDDT
ncbi:MAG TPA: phosphotransferase [Thermomicrobiales bacterium]|nr:phosphotransferase [Thermomicrobiales bacterium]